MTRKLVERPEGIGHGAATTNPPLHRIDPAVARTLQSLDSVSSLGVSASPAVRSAGAFDTVRGIKANGLTPKARRILSQAAYDLTGRDAALLWIACSEFSMRAPKLGSTAPVFDTIKVLTDAIQTQSLTKPR